MQKKFLKIIGLLIPLSFALAGLFFFFRQEVLLFLLKIEKTPTLSLQSEVTLNPEVHWFDDYYTIQKIDTKTIIISEPRYWQFNNNYLILGDDKALLFDSGPGVRNILPVVRFLTDLPIVVFASHLHYDHIGNHDKFNQIAMIDIPSIRSQVDNKGVFTPSDSQFLGELEGYSVNSFLVNQWVRKGDIINLGNRRIQVLSIPGHTKNSICLYDLNNQQAFVGDFIYPGFVLGVLPEGSAKDYIDSVDILLKTIHSQTKIYGAHQADSKVMESWKRSVDQVEPKVHKVMPLTTQDLKDFHDLFKVIKSGGRVKQSGFYPAIYRVNDSIQFVGDFKYVLRKELNN